MQSFKNMQQRIMAAMDTLAKRLKFARKRCGLNQEQLAELSGIGQSVISKIERGDIQKTTGIVALSKALDCSPMLLVSSLAFAHSGGTDSNGCHTNHKTGDRHCH